MSRSGNLLLENLMKNKYGVTVENGAQFAVLTDRTLGPMMYDNILK